MEVMAITLFDGEGGSGDSEGDRSGEGGSDEGDTEMGVVTSLVVSGLLPQSAHEDSCCRTAATVPRSVRAKSGFHKASSMLL